MIKWYRNFVIILLLLPQFAKADKIDKAFASLQEYNYFDAKEKFEKKLKKATSPAAYGLAIIYYRQDNPFHQIDSAYRLIRLAEASFDLLKEKKAVKYAVYGFSKKSIAELKQRISSFYFNRLNVNNSVTEWTNFAIQNPDSREYGRAIEIRDSLAFELTKKDNSSVAYTNYIQTYPKSKLLKDAQEGFYLAEYREQTKNVSVASYQAFISKYSQNPYRVQAEDQIYKITTEKNRVEDLNDFIIKNPANRNKDEAWRRLYQVYMYEYSDDRIEQFEKEFPQYPFKNEIKSDLKMARTILVPVKIQNKFGAMDLDGNIVIPVIYDLVSTFSEGLALVGLNDKYGYINKMNERVIPIQFDAGLDFEQGRAVVEKNKKYGLIDRSGKMILAYEFEDIGTFSDGLIYAQKIDLYGYFDKYGIERIKLKFDDAFSFQNGKAAVQIGEKQAIINTEGEFVFPPKYETIKPFSKNTVVFEEEGYFGIMDYAQKVILPAEYDEIGNLSNGFALINFEGKLGFIDSLGNLKIPAKFETFPNYLENCQFIGNSALAKSKGKYGLIDKTGKFIIPNIYNQLGVNSSLIAFNKGKLWGFIDGKNKVVIKPAYDWAESFVGETAIVAKFDQLGVINTQGSPVIPIQFDEISRMDKERFLVSFNDKVGLYDLDGKILVPVEYREIRQLNDSFYVLLGEERIDYLYLPENKLVRQK
tara:strand:+ start:38405 stop:40507 length:2103 start_codon:yes stop_codon:yes gene_type:complete